MPLKLIVGLRNPGPKYAATRHNAGAWLVQALADLYTLSFKLEVTFNAELADLTIEETFAKNLQENSTRIECKLMLPMTYMNESGKVIASYCKYYKIKPDELLIVHDDLDLPVGTIRLKHNGGHGGHNGLRDIFTYLGSQDFFRLRIGIGHPGHSDDVLNYVLGKPAKHDRQLIDEAIARSLLIIPMICKGYINEAMNQLNTRDKNGI